MKLGISLSGGGQRAIYYLGALKLIEEMGSKPYVVGGLSGGAIVAALYAFGYTYDQIVDISKELNFLKAIKLNPFDGVNLIDSKKVFNLLHQYFGDKQIEEANTKLLIFATDLATRRLKVFDKGHVCHALAASSAMVPIVGSYEFEGTKYIDGGFTVKYGAKYFRSAGAEKVIGMDIDSALDWKMGLGIGDFVGAVQSLIETNYIHEQLHDPIDIEITRLGDKNSNILQINYDSEPVLLSYQAANAYRVKLRKLLKPSFRERLIEFLNS